MSKIGLGYWVNWVSWISFPGAHTSTSHLLQFFASSPRLRTLAAGHHVQSPSFIWSFRRRRNNQSRSLRDFRKLPSFNLKIQQMWCSLSLSGTCPFGRGVGREWTVQLLIWPCPLRTFWTQSWLSCQSRRPPRSQVRLCHCRIRGRQPCCHSLELTSLPCSFTNSCTEAKLQYRLDWPQSHGHVQGAKKGSAKRNRHHNKRLVDPGRKEVPQHFPVFWGETSPDFCFGCNYSL